MSTCEAARERGIAWWEMVNRDAPDTSTYLIRDVRVAAYDKWAEAWMPTTRVAKAAIELLWFIPFPLKVRTLTPDGPLTRFTLAVNHGDTWDEAGLVYESARTVLAILLAQQYEYMFIEEQVWCERLCVYRLHTPTAYADRCRFEYGRTPALATKGWG